MVHKGQEIFIFFGDFLSISLKMANLAVANV